MWTLTRLTAAAILVFALAGCQSNGSTTQTTAPESSAATVPGMEVLALTDIQAKLSLSDEQSTKMTAALNKWHQSNELGVLDRAMGKGRGPWMGGDVEPPVHSFLMESATFLDTDDMVALVSLIKGQRQTHRKQFAANRQTMRKGEGFGPGRHGQKPDPLFEKLNLTEEQRHALDEARAAVRDEFEPGQRRDNVRDAMQEKLKEILTEEQLAALDSKRTERRAGMAERMQERVATASERRIEFLATVLKLSDDQKTRVEQIWQASAEERQQMRQSFSDESADRGNMREAMQSLRDAASASVRSVLTPDQAKLYDALEDMRPMGRSGRGNRAG